MNILEVGISNGEKKKLVSLVCKKLKKGCSPEEIANILEEDISVIQKICAVAVKYAPEYDEDKIWQSFLKSIR